MVKRDLDSEPAKEDPLVRGYTPNSGRLAAFNGVKRILSREAPPIPAPPWPLGSQTPREGELWLELWRHPVSILWREEDLTSKAALYARKIAEAEKPGSPASLLNALRGLADDLYLSVGAQRRAGIALADPGEDADAASPAAATASRSARASGAALRESGDGLTALAKVRRWHDRGLSMAAGNPIFDAAVRELEALGLHGVTPLRAISDGLV
jgi:hypothetical protein